MSIFFNFQLVAIFTIVTGCFDIYCLAMAAPGSTHYGYYIISYEFVYVGNVHGEFLTFILLYTPSYNDPIRFQYEMRLLSSPCSP